MQESATAGILVAFRIRSFRFQFCADLVVAWAIEMEVIILAWYILTATDSPFLLALLGALRFGGTLLSPLVGAYADRISRKRLLLCIRLSFTALALVLMAFALHDAVTPLAVFAVVTIAGLLRPADMMLRQSLIADTVGPSILTNALAFSRMTVDSARMFGALAGAGLMAALGLANAYIIVTVLYLASTLLTLFIQSGQRPAPASVARPFAELREGIMLLRDARALRHILYLAFLVNLTVLSITGGLLPLVARDIYGLDSLGLGVMAATFAGGALIGSLLTATLMRRFDPERLMFRCAILWHLLMAMYTQIDSANIGIPMLAVIGLVSSFVMVPMASCLLRRTPIDFRGRIMGLRQLAVFGLPLGLLCSGVFIEWTSVATALCSYSLGGAVFTFFLWRSWRTGELAQA